MFFSNQPVLKSLHDGTKHNLAATEDNSEVIQRVVIGVTILTIVGAIFGGITFVMMKIGCRARERLSNGVMALFRESGIRPSIQPPPFNL